MDSFRLLTRGSRLRSVPSDDKDKQQGFEGSHGQDGVPTGRKRKRDEPEINFQETDGDISSDDVRKLQKTHKIKFTDLKQLQHETKEGCKSHKEASRVFPQPLQRFSSLARYSTNHALLSNLAEQGYKEPTEVQLATIPVLMSEDKAAPNLLTVAPTGSGKTLAFLIPLINKISKLRQSEQGDLESSGVNAIILAPTKELVNQIVNEGRKLSTRTGVRVTAFKKGMKLHDKISSQEQHDSDDTDQEEVNSATVVKVDVIVSTPLSLLHAITPEQSLAPLPLNAVHTLILDEADVLLDPLFRSQTLAIWSACTSATMQCSLWSATIGSNIEDLFIDTIQSRYKALKIKSENHRPLLRCVIGLKDSSLPNIKHKLTYTSTEAGKLTGLRQLIRPPPSNFGVAKTDAPLHPPFLIFAQTISRAQALYSEIEYDIPIPTNTDVPSRIAVLHSDLPDTQRSKIMQNFRLGKIWVLITTDLLSRGIDFRGVNAVINYDIPTTPASYVHRAGRTGRAGRLGGTCVTFYTKDDVNYLRLIVNVIVKSQKLHGQDVSSEEMVPKWLLESLPYLSKSAKKEIKERGIDVRRAIKESDDKKERRRKGRNVIGTESGYEKKLADRRRGMVEGSQRRKAREQQDENSDGASESDGFAGFD